ncbi:MAG TPA: SRPBCC family protein [Pyrinomonadaceae bacterium]|nr:SRPBCC family protein [Pyrinomonadaceae bacterium]
MAEHILKRELTIELPRGEVFEFFSSAANLERITPSDLGFTITTPQPIEMREGTTIDYRIKLNGFPLNWKTLISKWDPPREFIDEQLSGPYKQWIHRHTFTEVGRTATLIEDEVRYRLPFEPLGDVAHFFVERQLKNIFDFREKAVAEYFKAQDSPPSAEGGRSQNGKR